MFSIEARRQRLIENCLKFWQSSAEKQYVIIHLIIGDCRILNVKMTDFLAAPLPIRVGSLQNTTNECPYCERVFGNDTGLKAHLGKRHQDKKAEWSRKI